MRTPQARGRRKTGPSIRDVAKLAGVSAQTVSRVSTGVDPVRPETRDKVLEAMRQVGYSPNHAARALRLGKFGAIGLMAHRYARTGEALIAASVIDAAEAHGYSVNLISIQTPDKDHWETAAHRISHQAIDGLVIIRAEMATPDTLTLPAGLPVVVSDSRLIGHYPAVTADQTGGSRMAVEHLLSLGHRTVHHLAGPLDSEPALIRSAGWSRTLELAGCEVPEPWIGDWTPGCGYAFGVRAAADPSVTAVYAANDEMAIGFMRGLHENGRRVPEDVSVVGFDGLDLGAYVYPPLTTIKHPFATIGSMLVDTMLEQIRKRGTGFVAPPRTVVPVDLVVRESTAGPPG
ncbi:LacI family DNA-binding transcriptional regulator [Tessaracoccus lubricantis]|uniref:LacI family DNA-binding transcriptional regulator n=1 Tax=Tessaracoccus lubricantis TaxID=545543 RepID=A0ABP9FSI3_9ACTN